MVLPSLVLSAQAAWPPDPVTQGAYYQGVTLRRIVAYAIDAVVLLAIMIALHVGLAILTVASFGLLWPLHLFAVPLAIAALYHTLLIAGPGSATLGMRVCSIRVHSINGGPPNLIQALVQTICFYVLVGFSGGLLLLVALFNRHRRHVHDFLAGTIVLRVIDP